MPAAVTGSNRLGARPSSARATSNALIPPAYEPRIAVTP